MNLHQEFRKLAFDINKMKNRLMMLLLEIYEKEIYKQHGCSTIYEYGFKYAKLSKETIQLALRTLKNTEDKPILREKIETQGIYKVAMVAKLATSETDKLYAEHVENMSKPALAEFAKEMRQMEGQLKIDEKAQMKVNDDCCEEFSEEYRIKCRAVTSKMTIELDEESQILFNQLKKKYAKDLSNKEALKIILKKIPGASAGFVLAEKQSEDNSQKDMPGHGISKNFKISNIKTARKTNINQKNQSTTLKIYNNQKNQNTTKESKGYQQQTDAPLPSRYVLVQTQRKVHEKTNGKCAYPGCTRPIENIHHTIPFSFNRSHKTAIGLCEIHHEFCHNGVIKNELKDTSEWELNLNPQRSLFDSFYLKYKAS